MCTAQLQRLWFMSSTPLHRLSKYYLLCSVMDEETKAMSARDTFHRTVCKTALHNCKFRGSPDPLQVSTLMRRTSRTQCKLLPAVMLCDRKGIDSNQRWDTCDGIQGRSKHRSGAGSQRRALRAALPAAPPHAWGRANLGSSAEPWCAKSMLGSITWTRSAAHAAALSLQAGTLWL